MLRARVTRTTRWRKASIWRARTESGTRLGALKETALSQVEQRMREQMDRLGGQYGVYIPGMGKAKSMRRAEAKGLKVSTDVVRRISEFAQRRP